jgi:transketolase
LDTAGPDIDELWIDTVRTLAMDAIQQAHSGHPGAPMALAPVIYCLWQRLLHFDPDHPLWPNRDRFVLSADHPSMLLYPMLHLTGIKAVNPKYEVLGELAVTPDDIKRFRQLDSKCPGHRNTATSGVETTTGRLGQGVAASGWPSPDVGGAGYFNCRGFEIFDYDVCALCGDGCIMEGISSEAASIAGHFRLTNLCWTYDNNNIAIEGNTALTYSDDVANAFSSAMAGTSRVWETQTISEALGAPSTRFRIRTIAQR